MTSSGDAGAAWHGRVATTTPAYFPAWGTGLVLLLVLTEPSSATGLSLAERTLFHAVQVFLPLGVALVAARELMASRAATLLPYWWGLAAIGAFAAVVSVPAFVALEIWLAPVDLDGDAPPVVRSFADWLRQWPGEALESGSIIVPIWLALNLGVRWLQPSEPFRDAPRLDAPARDSQVVAEPPAVVAPQSSFLDLLPAGLGQEIRYLRAEQHYVRVVTARGAALLLYAFGAAAADAVAAGIAGSALHRSVWVSFACVKAFERSPGGEGVCLLIDGTRLPVSRRRWTRVRVEFEAYARSRPTG